MKSITAGILAFAFLVAQSHATAVCGRFTPANESDCTKLIDDSIGVEVPAPIVNGQAVLAFGTCAIVTRPSPGQAVITKDFLARRGNAILDACDNDRISGFQQDPNFSRTCMLNRAAYVSLYFPICFLLIWANRVSQC